MGLVDVYCQFKQGMVLLHIHFPLLPFIQNNMGSLKITYSYLDYHLLFNFFRIKFVIFIPREHNSMSECILIGVIIFFLP